VAKGDADQGSGFSCAAEGGSAQPVPLGFALGPVILAPSLTTSYAYDSNVFQRSDAFAPSTDQVLTVQPAAILTVPFSNSAFRLGDTLRWVDYKNTAQVAGKTSNEAFADLNLRFATLDTLALSARRIAGVAETLAFDPGREVVFNGQFYRFHTETASIAREISGARGYRVALSRSVLRFDRSGGVAFFDYSGFDGEVSYLQSLSPNTRLAFGYLGSRYDHFDVGPGADPHAVFRTENGDVIYGQIEGRLGPRQPYRARLGWERLAFEGSAANDFSGLIGQADFSLIVGGGTILTLTSHRQPYRSFFLDNNFYVFDQIGERVDRTFPTGSSIGGSLLFARNSYGEPVPTGSAGEVTRRRDRTYSLEVYANLALRERFAFRLSIRENRRVSDYAGADYNDTVVSGGLVLGWF
jgi:hypothetical protein